MYKNVLLFFYTLLININDIIGVGFFILPFYIYQNTIHYTSIIASIIGFIYILIYTVDYNYYKKISLQNKFEKKEIEIESNIFSFFSNLFYYCIIVFSINSNICYIINIINIYIKSIYYFYITIAILVILFLFFLIKNKSSNFNFIVIICKIISILHIFYFLYFKNQIATEKNFLSSTKNNLINTIPILFFAFLKNQTLLTFNKYNEDDIIEKNIITNPEYIANNKNHPIQIIITYIVINIIYFFFYSKIISIFNKNEFLSNSTISEFLLKNYNQNILVHILNIFIITILFFNIYALLINGQNTIQKIIEKINQDIKIPELIILFFTFFCILIINKILLVQTKNITINAFFASFSFLLYIIQIIKISKNITIQIVPILILLSLLIINIISIIQFFLLSR